MIWNRYHASNWEPMQTTWSGYPCPKEPLTMWVGHLLTIFRYGEWHSYSSGSENLMVCIVHGAGRVYDWVAFNFFHPMTLVIHIEIRELITMTVLSLFIPSLQRTKAAMLSRMQRFFEHSTKCLLMGWSNGPLQETKLRMGTYVTNDKSTQTFESSISALPNKIINSYCDANHMYIHIF